LEKTISTVAAEEQRAERESKKLFARFQKRLTSRTNASIAFQTCAGDPKNFGSSQPQVQALIVKDGDLGANLIQLQLAYQNLDMLLNRYNSQLSATDDRLELLVENYTDALKDYTDCVARVRA
jgi:hypothetical protein